MQAKNRSFYTGAGELQPIYKNFKRKVVKMISETEIKKIKKAEITEFVKENNPYYFWLDLKHSTQ